MSNRIISRAEWGARYGNGSAGETLRKDVIVHTTVTALMSDTASQASEESVMRGMENYHVKHRGFNGLAYSFCISDSGRVYEARGWKRNGAHTQNGGNTRGYGIAFMGDGTKREPSTKAWAALVWLIGTGIDQGYIAKGYKVSGHRDWWKKECPGDLIYNKMQAKTAGITGAGSSAPSDRICGPGDNDSDIVKTWQTQLRDMFGSNLTPDGDFGPITEAATKEFEKAHGLAVDGYVSDKDVKKMGDLYKEAEEASKAPGDTDTADDDEQPQESVVEQPAPRHYLVAVRHGKAAADERIARALAAALHLHVARYDDYSTVGTAYLVGGEAVREFDRKMAEKVVEISGASRQDTLAEAAKIISDYINTI